MSDQTESFSPAEHVLHSTYRLKVKSSDQDWCATGFFFRVDFPSGMQSDLLVTCAHAIDGAEWLEINVRRRSGMDYLSNPIFETVRVALANAVKVIHPTEDLVMVFMHPYMKAIADRDGAWPLVFAFSEIHFPNAGEMDALEEVVMAGCPLGLFDEHNNFPILRRGITASHFGFDYTGKPRFLVDMACHEGSSGSPIFSWSVTSFNRKAGRYDLHLEPRARLIGILSTGLDDVDTTSNFERHGHLGVAIKSTELIGMQNVVRQIVGFTPPRRTEENFGDVIGES